MLFNARAWFCSAIGARSANICVHPALHCQRTQLQALASTTAVHCWLAATRQNPSTRSWLCSLAGNGVRGHAMGPCPPPRTVRQTSPYSPTAAYSTRNRLTALWVSVHHWDPRQALPQAPPMDVAPTVKTRSGGCTGHQAAQVTAHQLTGSASPGARCHWSGLLPPRGRRSTPYLRPPLHPCLGSASGGAARWLPQPSP